MIRGLSYIKTAFFSPRSVYFDRPRIGNNKNAWEERRRWCVFEKRGARGIKRLRVSGLLLGVDVPHDVIWKTKHLVAGTLSHLSEALCFCLVLEGIAGEINPFYSLLAEKAAKGTLYLLPDR